jgi:hypothetical protein
MPDTGIQPRRVSSLKNSSTELNTSIKNDLLAVRERRSHHRAAEMPSPSDILSPFEEVTHPL